MQRRTYISPVSTSNIAVFSGISALTVAAKPSGVESSCIPAKIAPGKFRTDMNGVVNLGTYGAQSSNGKSKERSNSHVSVTMDGSVDIMIS